MMYEMLSRATPAQKSFRLIVVDGGWDSSVWRWPYFPSWALTTSSSGAGERDRGTQGKQRSLVRKDEDRVYLPGRKNPSISLQRLPSFVFFNKSDEAHRFAITYHRLIKRREDFMSIWTVSPASERKKKERFLLILKY
jgi:excinuclease ABC subunit C